MKLIRRNDIRAAVLATVAMLSLSCSNEFNKSASPVLLVLSNTQNLDTIDLLERERGMPIEVSRERRLDWAPVYAHVKEHGEFELECDLLATEVETVYLGGGTPTFTDADALARLLAGLPQPEELTHPLLINPRDDQGTGRSYRIIPADFDDQGVHQDDWVCLTS